MGDLYRLLAIFVEQPWLAAAPGAVFLGLWIQAGRRPGLAAAMA